MSKKKEGVKNMEDIVVSQSQNSCVKINDRSDETMAATFELLRGYFDKKFKSLKGKLSGDSEAKTQSAAKRFKKDSDIEFKYKGNKKQYMFNLDVIDRVKVATKCFDRKQDDKGFKTLDKLVDGLNTRNKLIRMADKSVAGWNTVDEYMTDELASDSDDEKRIRQAEVRALRKKNWSPIIVPRAPHPLHLSKPAAKQEVQTSSPNERVKPTVVFVPHMSSKNNKHPDRRTFALDAASKAIGENTSLHNVGKGATRKATNTEVKYDNNHFVSGDFVDTDDRNVGFEQGRNKQYVKAD